MEYHLSFHIKELMIVKAKARIDTISATSENVGFFIFISFLFRGNFLSYFSVIYYPYLLHKEVVNWYTTDSVISRIKITLLNFLP